MARFVSGVVVAAAIVGAAAAVVFALAFFDTTTVETPEELFAVEYGWPIAWAESDASMGASLRELRGGDRALPERVPFNPWEFTTVFDGHAFLQSWAIVTALLLAAAAATWLTLRRVAR
ncbi:MAG: hypothetical protein M3321_07680 [Actinomycetota bacterium]|nr:hypothetical protein [Actinomycetota bacterium]